MTDVEQGSPLSVAEFYDALAPDYDTMTGFQKRFVHEKPFFRLLLEKYEIRTAVDAGCGTGFHSLLLAQLGAEVTAVDVSSAMIKEVKKHAKALNLTVNAVQAGFADLRKVLKSKFDAVFAMGNSMAHLLSDQELRSSFGNFASILKPRGILFLQNLNYDRILDGKERIQSVKEAGDKTFVRFYDYSGNLLTFNILTIERRGETVRQKMQSVRLNPVRSKEMIALVSGSGFTDIQLFGSIALEEYHPQSSKDLVILARMK
jgi:SAM-dependent methyltransferase